MDFLHDIDMHLSSTRKIDECIDVMYVRVSQRGVFSLRFEFYSSWYQLSTKFGLVSLPGNVLLCKYV